MSSRRMARPRSRRAIRWTILAAANGSPDAATVGGCRLGSGKPAGASRNAIEPGEAGRTVTVADISDHYPGNWGARIAQALAVASRNAPDRERPRRQPGPVRAADRGAGIGHRACPGGAPR